LLAHLRDCEPHRAEPLAHASGVRIMVRLRERHERHRAHPRQQTEDLRLRVIEEAVSVDE
jgi:hypothetical protein